MSLLSEALEPLFADTPVPGDGDRKTQRERTAFILDVGDEKLDAWLNDEILPDPACLRMLVDLIEGFPDITPSTTLLELLDRQLVEVTPARRWVELGVTKEVLSRNPRQRYTLGAFMLSEEHERLIGRLAQLSWRDQETVLQITTEKIRELKPLSRPKFPR